MQGPLPNSYSEPCDHFGMVTQKGEQRNARKCHKKRGAKGLMILTPQNMCTKDDPIVHFSTFSLFLTLSTNTQIANVYLVCPT